MAYERPPGEELLFAGGNLRFLEQYPELTGVTDTTEITAGEVSAIYSGLWDRGQNGEIEDPEKAAVLMPFLKRLSHNELDDDEFNLGNRTITRMHRQLVEWLLEQSDEPTERLAPTYEHPIDVSVTTTFSMRDGPVAASFVHRLADKGVFGPNTPDSLPDTHDARRQAAAAGVTLLRALGVHADDLAGPVPSLGEVRPTAEALPHEVRLLAESMEAPEYSVRDLELTHEQMTDILRDALSSMSPEDRQALLDRNLSDIQRAVWDYRHEPNE